MYVHKIIRQLLGDRGQGRYKYTRWASGDGSGERVYAGWLVERVHDGKRKRERESESLSRTAEGQPGFKRRVDDKGVEKRGRVESWKRGFKIATDRGSVWQLC